jgi:hypothetical protein
VFHAEVASARQGAKWEMEGQSAFSWKRGSPRLTLMPGDARHRALICYVASKHESIQTGFNWIEMKQRPLTVQVLRAIREPKLVLGDRGAQAGRLEVVILALPCKPPPIQKPNPSADLDNSLVPMQETGQLGLQIRACEIRARWHSSSCGCTRVVSE